MLGVMMSYVSHSQIWALQEDSETQNKNSVNPLYLGGKTNRAQVAFERELVSIVETLKVSND